MNLNDIYGNYKLHFKELKCIIQLNFQTQKAGHL